MRRRIVIDNADRVVGNFEPAPTAPVPVPKPPVAPPVQASPTPFSYEKLLEKAKPQSTAEQIKQLMHETAQQEKAAKDTLSLLMPGPWSQFLQSSQTTNNMPPKVIWERPPSKDQAQNAWSSKWLNEWHAVAKLGKIQPEELEKAIQSGPCPKTLHSLKNHHTPIRDQPFSFIYAPF